MRSFQTFFRTVVMLATLGLLAKAWYLYGPSVQEMKTIGARVAEVASQTWTEYWQKPADHALADDPRVGGAPAPFVPSGASIKPMPHNSPPGTPAANLGTVELAGGVPAEVVAVPPASSSTAWPQIAAPQATPLPPDNSQDSQLSAMLEQLAKLGVRDQEVSPWGSGGKLVRYSCSVPWTNSPNYGRHFEAVAATPLAAVEQVAAEIQAWQLGQR